MHLDPFPLRDRVLLLLITAAGGYWFLMGPSEEKITGEETPPAKPESEKETEIEKAHIYELAPFFLPVQNDGRETSQFITIAPHLLLSNSAMDEEVEKILPQIRKSIYNVLKRKSPQDFTRNRVKLEEQIKREIVASANANLLTGTGTSWMCSTPSL